MILLLLLLLFVQNQPVNTRNVLFDFMHRMNKITTYVKSNVVNIYDQVKTYISTNMTPNVNKFDNQDTQLNQMYAIETEQPEFLNMKLEPIMFFGTPQLAFWHGHNMESHVVRTEDGYSLSLHRITTHPLPPANRTVLLHHGLFGSSTDWILLGAKQSLPYLLSKAGYDVWIANARGNYFSRGHSSMTISFAEFWNFSFHEMGVIDLKAVIDYIRHNRNSDATINFIGHSMGCTALLVLLSTYPKYEKYLRLGVLLAPLAYMDNVQGPLKELANAPDEFVKMLGDAEFLPTRKVPALLAHKYCTGLISYCTNPLFFFSGVPRNTHSWSASFVARLLYHIPAGTSTKTILHYLQISTNKKFHKFDDPYSEYDTKNISLPMVLFSSSDDWLASSTDVLKLYFNLRNPIDHQIIRGINMSHTDFVWGPHAHKIIFIKVLDYLNNYGTKNSIIGNEIQKND